jgi:hypothetical protein
VGDELLDRDLLHTATLPGSPEPEPDRAGSSP